jgi:hypothetical protein
MPAPKPKATPKTMTKAGLRQKLWRVIAEAQRCEPDDIHIEEVPFFSA